MERKRNRKKHNKGISEKKIDLGGAFQEINGCAVIYSPVQEEYSFLMKICVGKKYRPILLLRLFQLY